MSPPSRRTSTDTHAVPRRRIARSAQTTRKSGTASSTLHTADDAQAAARVPLPSRRLHLLEAAGRVFCERGFKGATLRQIADAAGILAGSVYHHFPSKNELFLEVHHEGFVRLSIAVDAALQGVDDPWDRLEAVFRTHLEEMLSGSWISRVCCMGLLDPRGEGTSPRLQDERNRYENRLRELLDALPLRKDLDRTLLRLQLLGALNWTMLWYQPGRRTPREIAANLVKLLR